MNAIHEIGQLVWCPSDPSLGVGVVTAHDDYVVRVKFLHLNEERHYTLRTSEPPVARYEIANGEKAIYEGQEVRIRRRLPSTAPSPSAQAVYELDSGQVVAEEHLVPHVRDVGAKERLASLTLAHPEVIRARLQGLELAHFGGRPGNSAILGARAQWLPHQIDVASRALERDPIRLLLADEVGLGKTVEAALILAGLRHEGRATRVLVLVPEALTIQWLGEIYRKTHQLMVLLDDSRLEDARRDFPDLNPFEAYQCMVAGIERIAGDPILAKAAEDAPWDVVIVDEAHHLRHQKGRDHGVSYRLIEGLAQQTRHLLLLTATPMALDPSEYQVLLRLLDPQRFDDPDRFAHAAERSNQLRDVARELAMVVADNQPVAEPVARLARSLLADDPEDVQTLEAFLAQVPAHPDRRRHLEEVTDALQQRHSLSEYVTRNRRGPVGGLPKRHAQTFALTPTEEQDALLEVGETVMLELAAAIAQPQERGIRLGEWLRALWASPRALLEILRPYSRELVAELEGLVAQVTQAPRDARGLPTGDARLRWLVEQVWALKPGEKLLVFVESAVSVRALKEDLEPYLGGPGIAVFHRDLTARDQDRQVAFFRDPMGPQIMLSTEAGGEGRNFQFCHQLVLYDMPWRPATVEQRIGRIDRVGQRHDVTILVPFFKQGFEAAILKIMQQAIGVLDRTVGGIDHALEDVGPKIAELIFTGAGAEGYKKLFRDVSSLVTQAQSRIEAGVDPILDHASFSPHRAEAILSRVPHNLEVRLAEFTQRYADHVKMQMHARQGSRVAVEGGMSAAGSSGETGYIATFSRTDALDHEDLEFLSFGHPLVESALTWAEESHDTGAALALCRGCDRDGAAFLWTFRARLPDDVPEALVYLSPAPFTLALDEGGAPQPTLAGLLASSARPLDRMDPTSLRGNIERWRRVVERNFDAAEAQAKEALAVKIQAAQTELTARAEQQRKHLRRRAMRHLAALEDGTPERQSYLAECELQFETHDQDMERVRKALAQAAPQLVTAVAVRMMKAKAVSA